MNITLIAPKMSLRPMDSEYKRLLAPSLALLTVANLTPEEHTVTLEDENVKPLSFNLNGKRPDLVGINVNVDTSARAYAIAKRYRAAGVPVVLGGIHASACPEEGLHFADAVCVGEAEEIWHKILRDTEKGKLEGKYYHRFPTVEGRIVGPRRDLLKNSPYLYSNIVCASRGCPHHCNFCYNSCDYVHPYYRPRPVDTVIREIKAMGTKHVMFVDDNLLGDPRWTKDLVSMLQPLGLTWHAAVSANIGKHPELIDAMAASGCRSVFIGFETLNESTITGVKKRQNKVETYNETIAMIHERGIMVNASMVFGFDADTPQVFPDTLNWLIRNKVETLTSHILTPYPGTKLYQQWDKEGRIDDYDWRNYNTSNVVFQPKGMSKKELRDGYLWIYRKFYSTRNIIRRLPKEPGVRMPYLLFNFGYRKFGKITSQVSRLGGMHTIGAMAGRLSYGI